MTKPRWGGKEKLISIISARENWTHTKTSQRLEMVLNAMKSYLGAGHSITIEGIGVLTVVTRRQYRKIEKNLKQGPTIIGIHKCMKTVKLRHPNDLGGSNV